MVTRDPLEVMITVDVEAWPRCADWRADALAGDLARDIYGATPDGDFGIKYQVDFLRKHGLKGVFFVEALMACEIGIGPLAKIVEDIQEAGSEVQLHIHTEWFEKMTSPLLGDKRAYNIRELSLTEQIEVIEKALENLRAAGATSVNAYRAGNFGADFQTLSALADCGIEFDSSYNYSYLATECGLGMGEMMLQPAPLEGLWEYPVANFRDYPGHYRPAQLCAVSDREMRAALDEAHKVGWQNFVIVSHSFELLRDRKLPQDFAHPDWALIQRFDALCEFLASHKSRFETVGFLDLHEPPRTGDYQPLHPPMAMATARTAARVASQALRRLPRERENTVRKALARVGLGKF
ncbi:MAG: polysaccharide deacetylase [Myxococcales bacterium]|nr:polysaccharide deacetylase [Myxococcales bacterium]